MKKLSAKSSDFPLFTGISELLLAYFIFLHHLLIWYKPG